MSSHKAPSLWDLFCHTASHSASCLWDADREIRLAALASGSALAAGLEELRGRTVLITTSSPIAAALALIETDGLARRLVLCPPDLDPRHLPYVMKAAGVDVVVTDAADRFSAVSGVERVVPCADAIHRRPVNRTSEHDTEWILFTSGTTGVPKMVVHTRGTLTGAIARTGTLAGPIVWATFYDIRRYGGLQIFLRVVIGGGSLVLAPGEGAESLLSKASSRGATHVTGTPSHWRRALMSPAARMISPAYARLSGEIADQAIIDHLQSTYPQARVAHAFASTEAGVAFEVTDGRAGFPSSVLGPNDSGVQLRIQDDTLRIRSPRTALRYLAGDDQPLLDAEGFVDTGDVVERRSDRYYFVGRRGGIINVGGLKIHPEEVEAVINQHPGVRMSVVTARKNPIVGTVVAAEVVLASDGNGSLDPAIVEDTRREILEVCRRSLAAHKVPASIRFTSSLAVSASGKLDRRHA